VEPPDQFVGVGDFSQQNEVPGISPSMASAIASACSYWARASQNRR
jgi:hypothetical protein